MKKLFLLIFSCAILFSGCKSQINRTFDGEIIGSHTISSDGNQFIVNVSEDEIVITIDSGDYKGLSYKFTNNRYEINYNDLVCKSDLLYILKNSLIATIADVFNNILSNKEYMGLSEYNPYISGTCGNGNYKVIFSSNDGKIVSITLTGLNTELRFLY